MRIPILTFGAIASILTINSVLADTVVTSRGYVDAADALKQDKITAGTTGSVVTYNGAQNGQTQFSERGIFNFETDWDDENGEIVSGHEGDLLDAGSIFPGLVGMGKDVSRMREDLNEMNSALQGTAGNVITYNENGFAGGERGIYDGSNEYDSSTDADKLVTASVVQNVSNNLPRTTVAYKTCTEWVAGMPHFDHNCLLWALDDKNVYGGCTTSQDCDGRCKMCVDGACVRDPNCEA